MAVPTFENFLYPFLYYLNEGVSTFKEMKEKLKTHFSMSESDLKELTRSGRLTKLDDRVGWCRQYMRRALMLDITGGRTWVITKRGKDYLQNHTDLRISDLLQFKEYAEFAKRTPSNQEHKVEIADALTQELTPTDQLENAFETIQNDLANDLLTTMLEKSPVFFEHLVVDLLLKMGYGDSLDYSKIVTPLSHDGGIDGIISQDKLGLDKIYIQAKRYACDNIVGRPTIQSFSGALSGQHATKGVFITTSDFSDAAVDYVKNLSQKIILINGTQLAHYMIEYNVGVSTKKVYEVKRIDSDYFEEE